MISPLQKKEDNSLCLNLSIVICTFCKNTAIAKSMNFRYSFEMKKLLECKSLQSFVGLDIFDIHKITHRLLCFIQLGKQYLI